jgi:hypothetical protein
MGMKIQISIHPNMEVVAQTPEKKILFRVFVSFENWVSGKQKDLSDSSEH